MIEHKPGMGYTPTMIRLRGAYIDWGQTREQSEVRGEEFDRAIAAHDAEVRAEQREADARIAEATEPTYGNTTAWVNPGNRAVAAAIRV